MVTKTLKLNIEDGDLTLLIDELEVAKRKIKEVEGAADKTDNALQKVGDNGGAIAILDSLTGGLATQMKDAFEATKLFNFSLKGTKTALIATGIGAFVVAAGVLVAYWDDISNYITGANIELQEQKELTNAININLERRNDLEKDSTRLLDNQTKERILRAKLAGASESELTNIQREGLQNRIKDLEQLSEESNRILKQSVGADFEVYVKAQEDQEEAFRKLGEARSALSLFDLETELNNRKPKRGANQERIEEPLPLTGLLGMDNLNEVLDAEFNALALTERARTNLVRVEGEERTKAAKEEAAAKIQTLYAVSNAFGALGSAIGEQTALGKSLAISGALINTYLGITEVLGAPTTIPEPFGTISKIANSVVIGTAGFAAVKNISSVQVPGGNGGGAIGTGSPSRPPAFNVVDQAVNNQIATSLLGQSDTPIQTFVVDKDITSAQSLRRNKIEDSSL